MILILWKKCIKWLPGDHLYLNDPDRVHLQYLAGSCSAGYEIPKKKHPLYGRWILHPDMCKYKKFISNSCGFDKKECKRFRKLYYESWGKSWTLVRDWARTLLEIFHKQNKIISLYKTNHITINNIIKVQSSVKEKYEKIKDIKSIYGMFDGTQILYRGYLPDNIDMLDRLIKFAKINRYLPF